MDWLNLLGALFGLVGTVVLAFSLNGVLGELRLSIDALNTSVESVAAGSSIYIFRGLKQRLLRADSQSKVAVRLGLGVVGIGFILQAAATFVPHVAF